MCVCRPGQWSPSNTQPRFYRNSGEFIQDRWPDKHTCRHVHAYTHTHTRNKQPCTGVDQTSAFLSDDLTENHLQLFILPNLLLADYGDVAAVKLSRLTEGTFRFLDLDVSVRRAGETPLTVGVSDSKCNSNL